MPRTAPRATPRATHYQPIRTFGPSAPNDPPAFVLVPIDATTVRTIGDLAYALHQLGRQQPHAQVDALSSRTLPALLLERRSDERLFAELESDLYADHLPLVPRSALPAALTRGAERTTTTVDRHQRLTLTVEHPARGAAAHARITVEALVARAEELGIPLD